MPPSGIQQDRQVAWDDQGATAELMYRVRDAADEDEARGAADIPTTYPGRPNSVLRRITVRPVREGGLTSSWDVTAEYRDTTWRIDDSEPEENTYRVDTSTPRTIVPVWRIGTSAAPLILPATPAKITNPDTTDIKGLHVDVGGEPIDDFRRNWEVTISWEVNGLIANLPALNAARYKRNNAAFTIRGNTFAEGTLLLLDARISEQDDVTRISITFAADEYYHLQQVPERNDEGEVILVNSNAGEADPYTVGRASNVYWYQPFPGTANFAALGIPGTS